MSYDRRRSLGDLTDCLDRVQKGITAQGSLLMQENEHTGLNSVRPLLDAVNLFEQLNIRYALIGGLAAMYYGRARFTDDIDFIAEFLHESVLRANSQAMIDNHFDPACTYKLYHTSGTDVDLWKDEFVGEMLDRAGDAMLAQRRVKIVEANDLAAMKLRAGRLQDDYDISEVLKAGVLDLDVIRRRVSAAQFAHLLEIQKRTGQ